MGVYGWGNIPTDNFVLNKKAAIAAYICPILFLLYPIDYPTTCEMNVTASKNESFTNSFANVVTGLFSIQSKM